MGYADTTGNPGRRWALYDGPMFHRFARLLLEGLAVLALVLVAGIALGAWRLSQGPVSVGFLSPLLDKAIEDAMPGYAIEFEDTVLVWAGWDHGFDVRMRDLAVFGPAGSKVAEFSEATVRLSGRALVRGRVEPSHILVDGPVLKLERGEDGIVRFAGQGENALTLGTALAPRADGAPMADVLQQITISGAEIEFTDVPTRALWRAREANVVLSRKAGTTTLDADLRVLRRDRSARITLRAGQQAGAGRIDTVVTFEDVSTDLIADLAPEAARLSALTLALSGRLELGFDGAGRLLNGAGRVAGRNGRFTDATLFPEPVAIRSLSASGRYDIATQRAELSDVAIELDGGRIDARATLQRATTRLTIAGTARARAVPVDALARLWPLRLAPNARRWMTTNLSGGQVDDTQVEFALVGPEFAALKLTRLAGVSNFQGVGINYLNPMPRVLGVAGSATLGVARIDVATTSGAVGALRVDESKIALSGLDTGEEFADIQILVRGAVRDQVQLLDSPPLNFMKTVALGPGDFGGEAATRARFVFPLISRLKVEQLAVTGSSDVKGFALKRAALGQDARDGDLTLKFDEKSLNATGKLVVGRTPTEVDYTLGFLSTNPVRERIKASGRLPAGELANLGFDFTPYLEGPLPLSLDYTARRNGTGDLVIEAGLEQATLTLSDLGWQKPPGQPGSGRLELQIQREKPFEIRNLRISAGDADVTGRIRFTPDGKSIARADLEKFRVGRTNVRASVIREQRGWRAQISGAAVDLSEIKIELGSEQPRPTQSRLSVDATIGRVWIDPDRFLQQVSFRGERSATWERAQLTASGIDRKGKTDTFNLNLTTDTAGRQELRGKTANAGAMLRSLGVTDKMLGGELELEGATDEKLEGKPLALDIRIKNYRIVDEPAIARFLATAFLTGIPDSMRGEGIGFDRFDGRALVRNSVIDIIDMRTSGPAIGIQARGRIDIGADRMDMDGTIVPANAVNSLFGKIPVIGEILFGPGLFAARYSVRGPRSNPEVTINPLSALAPGVLRNIFGIFDGGGTPPQGNAAPPAFPSGSSDQ